VGTLAERALSNCGYFADNVATHKLTATQISKAKPKNKPYKLSDGHGLFPYVAPTGGKLWRWSYRFNGAMKLMSFGPYPEITLEKVRELHMSARRTLLSGVDPMAQKMEERRQKKTQQESSPQTAINTFRKAEAKWHENWKVGKSKRHAEQVQNRIDADILPKLGGRPIDDIGPMKIVEVAKAIEERGCGDLAHRSISTMGQIFRFAVANGIAKRNPVSDVKPRDILKEVTEHNSPASTRRTAGSNAGHRVLSRHGDHSVRLEANRIHIRAHQRTH
jgi:hypothetical protein